jgi:Cytosolic domain of 10TM putative phosphate transporter
VKHSKTKEESNNSYKDKSDSQVFVIDTIMPHWSWSTGTTVWDALLSLPRSSLDAYQPLVNLSQLFRGKTVPSTGIDYYTTKLNLLTSLISDNRAKTTDNYDAVSTAFVTFADPAEARRACKFLAVHPNGPLACLVTMAPMYQDIDWIRVMKYTNKGEVSLSSTTFTLSLLISLLIISL